ncbi:MAG: hypothetical protein ACUVWX_11870 [Kiritimatiellia bacterium]
MGQLLPLWFWGASGIVGQIVLWRELLVGYGGNELSTGAILGNWLVAEAVGAFLFTRRWVHRVSTFLLLRLLSFLYSVIFPLAILEARVFRHWSGYALGEAVGFGPTVFSSLAILAPLAFLHGALFSIACRLFGECCVSSESSTIGTVYLWETVGTLFGAIITHFYFTNGGTDTDWRWGWLWSSRT